MGAFTERSEQYTWSTGTGIWHCIQKIFARVDARPCSENTVGDGKNTYILRSLQNLLFQNLGCSCTIYMVNSIHSLSDSLTRRRRALIVFKTLCCLFDEKNQTLIYSKVLMQIILSVNLYWGPSKAEIKSSKHYLEKFVFDSENS